VKKLVGKVGIGVLARAYFDGNFSALKIRFGENRKHLGRLCPGVGNGRLRHGQRAHPVNEHGDHLVSAERSRSRAAVGG
jgi:hypothetical protein